MTGTQQAILNGILDTLCQQVVRQFLADQAQASLHPLQGVFQTATRTTRTC